MGDNSFLGTERDLAAHPAASTGGEARCPSCGGLVAADAEWCGQCYSSLVREPDAPAPQDPQDAAGVEPTSRAPAGSTSVAAAAGTGVEVTGGKASWDCPVCGERNPIEAGDCETCQTPFARLFEEPSSGPEVEPRTAALWSLAFAGLGHWKAGLRAEGVARMVLFAWTLGTVLVVLAGGGASGASTPLFALYLVSAIAIYVLSAVDAYRVADGVPQLVSSRVLLWASAALVLVSIALATLVTLPAARG